MLMSVCMYMPSHNSDMLTYAGGRLRGRREAAPTGDRGGNLENRSGCFGRVAFTAQAPPSQCRQPSSAPCNRPPVIPLSHPDAVSHHVSACYLYVYFCFGHQLVFPYDCRVCRTSPVASFGYFCLLFIYYASADLKAS